MAGNWIPFAEMAPMKPQRLLLCGIFEGHKWIEICQWIDGGWCTANGQGVLGIRYYQKLPPFPEEL